MEATVKQKRFAEGIVAGKSKTVAYALAHPDDRSSRRALQNQASQASKSPLVQAELQRLLKEPIILEKFPDANNPQVIRAHALAVMTRLSQRNDVPVIQFQAATWLKDYADKLEVTVSPTNNGALIADLRSLYQRALKAAPLIETVAETETPETADSVSASETPETET